MTDLPRALAATVAIENVGIGALGQDDLPPLHVPMRFFVTAALFGALAGAVWLVNGEASFGDRYAPSMLAAVHLLTLGCYTMVMFGALFQVVPVLGGGGLPRARLVAALVQPTLAAGAASLAYGLWRGERTALLLALLLLGITFAVFVPAVGGNLLRRRSRALRPLRLAMLCFVLTIGLGATLAGALAWPEAGLPFRTVTNQHAAAGGLGFALLLIVGTSQQVVPMFHVTRAFSRAATRFVAPGIAVGLGLLWLPGLSVVGTLVLVAAGLWHAGETLWLLAARRRRRKDPAVMAWQIGLASIAASLLLAALDLLGPEAPVQLALGARRELLLGQLFGFAGVGTIVSGMLTKIVPFLAFLHLQRRCLAARAPFTVMPTMEALQSRRMASLQVVSHVAAAALVVTATLWPGLGRFAGAATTAAFAVLGQNLVTTWARHRRAATAIDRAAGTAAASA
ncbi:MAG: hypothetical protein IT455_06400 [Planctomycetes bacterium]|nr:hypothetical protein [Planctomycetota bacterium]